jgi:hypothetical protein
MDGHTSEERKKEKNERERNGSGRQQSDRDETVQTCLVCLYMYVAFRLLET